MGRAERKRYSGREKAFELVESGRPLSPDEIAYIKSNFSGIGGLVPADWSRGQFFTPEPVVRFIHALVGIDRAPGSVLEPACGSGAFFEGLDDCSCTGIEACGRTSKVAEACYPGAQVIHGNAEEAFPAEHRSSLEERFDYVLGNPPFGLKIEWTGSITAGKTRRLASEAVFMEIACRAAKPGGKIAFVVPEGLLHTKMMEPVRRWLMERCFIRAVISLPNETFFHSGTSTKTSILYLQKFPEGVTHEFVKDYQIFMSICEDIGWDSRGRQTGSVELCEILEAWWGFECQWKYELKDADGEAKSEPAKPAERSAQAVAEGPKRAKAVQLSIFG